MQKFETYLRKNHPIMWLAAKHHRTHKGEMLDFKNRPFLKQIYLDTESKSIMKSTQCGVSEYLISLVVGMAAQGKSVFHVLPTYDLVRRFVINRFNRTIQFSPYYQNIVSDGENKNSDSVSLKLIGKGSVAIVGSNTPNPFTEYPADIAVVDEEDQCNPKNLVMTEERLSNSDDRRMFRVSNPTVDGFGIHKRWLKSNQFLWHITCECGHQFNPDFFLHVIKDVGEGNFLVRDEDWEWGCGRDINLICDKCGKPVDRKKDGRWIATKKGPHGYHISKLFSTNVTLTEMVERFDEGLSDEEVKQRFYNADLGLPYTSDGSRLTETMIDKCVGDYNMEYKEGACVAGFDVGSFIHCKISQILPDGRLKAVFIGSVREEADVDKLFQMYNIVTAVIDAGPEKRMSERLCNKHAGMFRCYYGNVKNDTVDQTNKVITVKRTPALDQVVESIVTQKVIFPRDARTIPEFYDHLTSSTRIFDPNADQGRGDYKWVESSADHLFHASGYELIAKNLLVAMAR